MTVRQQPDKTGSTSELIQGIRRIELRVGDIDRAVGFYGDIVGLEVAERESVRASLRSPGGDAILALDAHGVALPASRVATGLFHTAIRFPDRRSLGMALSRLVAADYEIGAGDHGVSEAIYIDDPDGNGVELYRDRPREEWPKPEPGERVHMGTAPVDLYSLLEEAKANDAGSLVAPEETVVGHVHLQVSDLGRTIPFYTDTLGLDLMARIGNQAAFFSSGGYHHHIGANIWNSRGQGPASRAHAGLERVVFTVGNRKVLVALRERLGNAGYQDRSSQDEAVMRDPDGIELQFTAPS
ncbi:MAG: VOC family protein [Actinomycetota bacterium]